MNPLSEVLHNLNKEKKYLLAISGGVDSMVLLHLFMISGLCFSVVHCNYQLRGEESDLDEKLVKEYCEKYKLNFFVRKFDTLKLKKNRESIEMIARELRYEYFKELLKEYSFDYLVTAHHQNDQIETFFINLLRGSGLKGLAGMQVKSGQILRPLLTFSRKGILDFAVKNSIVWREDHTNQQLEYLRNKIRHKIIPEMEDINTSFLHQAEKSMQIIRSSQEFIDKKTKELSQKSFISDENNIKIFSREVLLDTDFILVYHFFSQYGFINENDCHNILKAKTGSIFESKTHKIWVDRNRFFIEKPKNREDFLVYEIIDHLPFSIQKPFPLEIIFSGDLNYTEGVEMIDFNKVSLPLLLRNWEEGDYFYPINGRGKKKVSKYLKDEKVASFDKNGVLVLCDNSGAIIWLVGYRLDDRFKISDKTINYVFLK